MTDPPDRQTHARSIAGRIEDLYGAPLADLEARAGSHPAGGMLAALLGSHADLVLAEQSIALHLQRLRQLADPLREVTSFEASHLLDCSRRISEAVAVRDVHIKTVTAVLQSLHRAPVPDSETPAPVPAIAPTPLPVPVSSPSR